MGSDPIAASKGKESKSLTICIDNMIVGMQVCQNLMGESKKQTRIVGAG